MEGRKALFSRRSNSNREHYCSVISGEDEESGTELQVNRTSLFHSSSEDGSVFCEGGRAKGGQDSGGSDEKRVHSSKPSAPVESRIRKKKSGSVGSDHVDMSIKSSKDLSKGFKRNTSENRDIVYHFNWLDIMIGIASIVVFFVDVVSDIKLAVDYFLDSSPSRYFYGGVTTALIIGPSLVTCCFGLHWYIIDYNTEKNVISRSKQKGQTMSHVTASYVWFFRFFFTALQFGPVIR